MAFVEDLSPFLADFGVDAVLDGAAVRGVFDSASFVEMGDGVVTQLPTFLLPAPAALPAPGVVLSIGGVSYIVRRVSAEPPDGAFVRLTLARS